MLSAFMPRVNMFFVRTKRWKCFRTSTTSKQGIQTKESQTWSADSTRQEKRNVNKFMKLREENSLSVIILQERYIGESYQSVTKYELKELVDKHSNGALTISSLERTVKKISRSPCNNGLVLCICITHSKWQSIHRNPQEGIWRMGRSSSCTSSFR